MKNAKAIVIIGVLIIGSICAYAQPKGEREQARKKIEARKVAYLTTELDLTPTEAQVFWPVYNQAHSEQMKLRKEQHQLHKSSSEGENKNTIDTMTDDELEKMMAKMMDYKQAELDLQRKYLQKYKEVLPMKKVAKLHSAEMKFKRKLMSDIGKKGPQRDGQRPSHGGHSR